MLVLPAQRIVILSVDRLNCGYLGPWGNTWVETPALDGVAARSFVLDRALIDSPSLGNLFHGLWGGRHAVGAPASATTAGAQPSLPETLQSTGWQTTLLTDEPAVESHPLAARWQQIHRLQIPSADKLASDISTTYWSEYFGTAIELLGKSQSRSLLWLHTAALGSLWDAPLTLREHYTDEEDPPPQDNPIVPRSVLPADYDPDLLLEISHAYAAQIGLLDTCIEALVEAIEELPDAEDTLLVIVGTRGMPLGEHRRVGTWDDRLYAELVQLPLLLHWPARIVSPGRSVELVQLPDLLPTILEAAGAPLDEHYFSRSLWPLIDMQDTWQRDRACLAAAHGERAIHSAWWSLRFSEGAAEDIDPTNPTSQRELFVKPDDRFEVNNVARRRDDIADRLQQGWEETAHWAETCRAEGDKTSPPPLDDAIAIEP